MGIGIIGVSPICSTIPNARSTARVLWLVWREQQASSSELYLDSSFGIQNSYVIALLIALIITLLDLSTEKCNFTSSCFSSYALVEVVVIVENGYILNFESMSILRSPRETVTHTHTHAPTPSYRIP